LPVNCGATNWMHRSIANGGQTCLRDGGDFNFMSYCLGLNYLVKGYNNQTSYLATTVIGCHTESTTSDNGGSGYLLDPDNLQPQFGRAVFRDCTCSCEHSGTGTTNGAKFAVVKDIYANGCQFLNTPAKVSSCRIAEDVGRCRVKDTFLSRDFFFESGLPAFPESVRLERMQIGNGTHDPDYAVGRGKCDVLTISDCVMNGYKFGGIDWWGAGGTYTMIAAKNCDFNGKLNNLSTFDIRPTTGGQLKESRKLQWLGNRRSNSGTGAASALFTDPATSNESLGSTRDASIQVYADTAAPTGTLVTWAIGDIVMNATPTYPGYVGWICTAATPAPGTWKQFATLA
jgi:hypothetical protein